MLDHEELTGMTVDKLKKLGREHQIKGYYKMRKEELLEALTGFSQSPVTEGTHRQICALLEGEPKIYELRKMAKQLGLTFQRNMKKTELIDRIKRVLVKHPNGKPSSKTFSSHGTSQTKQKRTQPEPVRELKNSYGKDKMVGLAVNPHWIHFYWVFSSQTEHLLDELAQREITMYLRVYDVSMIQFDGSNAHRTLEYRLDLKSTQKYYVHVPSADASFLGEIGYYNEQGQFIPLLRSNLVRTPADSFSIKREEKWLDRSSGFRFSELSKGMFTPVVMKGIGGSSASFEEMAQQKFVWVSRPIQSGRG